MKIVSARYVARALALGKGTIAMLALTVSAIACQRPALSPVAEAAPRSEVTAQPSAKLPEEVWQGVCFAHNWQDRGANGYGSEASAASLDHLAAIGVEWISITPFGFMPDLSANHVDGEHNRTAHPAAESTARLEKVVTQARSRGIRVMLKPHIWVEGGKWRGAIQPKGPGGELDWEGWWTSYEGWMRFYAELAQRLDLEALVVGLELHTAVRHDPDRFLKVVASVRDLYAGHLTYAANWNEEVPDRVWVALDSVGVQFYPPLSKRTDVVADTELRESLRRHLSDWNARAERVGRPLVITEVGYRSANHAARYPNAWPEKMKGAVDEKLQQQIYKAFFAELQATPKLGGVFLWKYFTDATTTEEGPDGFSPRGKSAEAVIRRAYGAKFCTPKRVGRRGSRPFRTASRRRGRGG